MSEVEPFASFLYGGAGCVVGGIGATVYGAKRIVIGRDNVRQHKARLKAIAVLRDILAQRTDFITLKTQHKMHEILDNYFNPEMKREKSKGLEN
ncbi:hypothetical protein ACFL0U_02505 [Pseudomonadota bacterium]